MNCKNPTLLTIIIGFAILFLSACSNPTTASSSTATATPEHTYTKKPEATTTPSPTTEPTATETPTPTNTSTLTTTVTKTPRPSLTPTAIPEGVEIIHMKTSDDIDLVGYLHRPETTINEEYVVVLAHGHTQSHVEWESFVKLLLENGITTMTFDFRGWGASSGSDQLATNGIDVTTVFNYVRSQGYKRVVCVGSSSGGTACLAGAIGGDINGLVMLSSMMNIPGIRLVSGADFKALAIPKIIMYAENDMWFLQFPEEFEKTVEIAGEPKEVYILPGIGHGSGLFYDENGEEVVGILLNFLKELGN